MNTQSAGSFVENLQEQQNELAHLNLQIAAYKEFVGNIRDMKEMDGQLVSLLSMPPETTQVEWFKHQRDQALSSLDGKLK